MKKNLDKPQQALHESAVAIWNEEINLLFLWL